MYILHLASKQTSSNSLYCCQGRTYVPQHIKSHVPLMTCGIVIVPLMSCSIVKDIYFTIHQLYSIEWDRNINNA